jgi:hypothetical protein
MKTTKRRGLSIHTPIVSGAALFEGNEEVAIVANRVFGTFDGKPKHVGFTLNSDAP